jgi:hypothetical protein
MSAAANWLAAMAVEVHFEPGDSERVFAGGGVR